MRNELNELEASVIDFSKRTEALVEATSNFPGATCSASVTAARIVLTDLHQYASNLNLLGERLRLSITLSPEWAQCDQKRAQSISELAGRLQEEAEATAEEESDWDYPDEADFPFEAEYRLSKELHADVVLVGSSILPDMDRSAFDVMHELLMLAEIVLAHGATIRSILMPVAEECGYSDDYDDARAWYHAERSRVERRLDSVRKNWVA
jgi:hypothetical protein